MGLISALRARARLKRNLSTRIQKAGVRMQVAHRRATGEKVRLYTNKLGEVFAVKRTPYVVDENIRKEFQPAYWNVHVSPVAKTALGLDGQILANDSKRVIHIISANVTGGDTGNGRELFRALIDESKQIGIKMFPHTPYTIYVKAANKKLYQYYQDLGFNPIFRNYPMLQMKVKAK